MPVWETFKRLARGRSYTQTGAPLPLAYRDIRDAVERCKWPDKDQLETWLISMDDTVFDLIDRKRQKETQPE